MISNVHLLKERNGLLKEHEMLLKKTNITSKFLILEINEIANNNLAILTNDDLKQVNEILLNFNNTIERKLHQKTTQYLIEELDKKQNKMNTDIIENYFFSNIFCYQDDDKNTYANYLVLIMKQSEKVINILIKCHKMSQEILMSINNNNQIINNYLENSMNQHVLQYLGLPILLYAIPIQPLFVSVKYSINYNKIAFNNKFTFDNKFNNILNYINTPLMKISAHIKNMDKCEESDISDEDESEQRIISEPVIYYKELMKILKDSPLNLKQLYEILKQLAFKTRSNIQQKRLTPLNNKEKILRNMHTSG